MADAQLSLKPAARDSVLTQRFLAERIASFYARSHGASINNACLWLACLITMWSSASAWGVAVWITMHIVYQLTSVVCVILRQRDAERDAHAQFWARCSAVAMGLGGLSWATGLMVTFNSSEPLILAFWGLVFSGIAAAVVAANPFYFPALVTYLVPLLGVHGLMHAQAGSPINWGIAVVSLLYLVFCLAQGRHHLRLMIESLDIRLRNEVLYAQLQTEKEAAIAARAQAEEASRAKARFFAAASHDLRQPLHGLGLYAEALKTHPDLPADAVQLVGRMESGVQSLAILFEGVMEMAQLESSDYQPKMQWLAVSGFLDSVDSRFAPAAAQAGLRWRVSCAPALEGGFIHCDGIALQRVVNNLVSNALRYTPRGAVMLCVRKRANHVRMELRDSGLGIAAHEQARIFEPFYQIGNSQRSRERGVGLGLATVRRLSELMNLNLQLRSELGRGSVFTWQLPFAHSLPPDAARLQDNLPSAWQLANELLARRCALVIEDEPQVRTATVHLLQSWGMQVLAAADAQDLLEQASHIKPDIIISDWMLARGDGLMHIAQLRAQLGSVPALLISGALQEDLILQAASQGVQCLAKPVKPAALRGMLVNLCKDPTLIVP
jgi:two-component system, sensor histidine kinase